MEPRLSAECNHFPRIMPVTNSQLVRMGNSLDTLQTNEEEKHGRVERKLWDQSFPNDQQPSMEEEETLATDQGVLTATVSSATTTTKKKKKNREAWQQVVTVEREPEDIKQLRGIISEVRGALLASRIEALARSISPSKTADREEESVALVLDWWEVPSMAQTEFDGEGQGGLSHGEERGGLSHGEKWVV
jgi:6-phosphogluconate dehydrogenase